MSIKILISEAFLPATGGADMIEVQGNTIDQCLRVAAEKFPPLKKMWFDPGGSLASYLVLFLNGENVPRNRLAQAVKDGDEIYPIMALMGG